MVKVQKYSVTYKKANGKDLETYSGVASLKVNTESSVAPVAYPATEETKDTSEGA